jgi:hypothetical protein
MGVQKEIYNLVGSRSYQLRDAELGDFSITFEQVSHVDNIPSFGIEIANVDMKVYFSGDSNSIKGSVLERLKSGDIDRLYQDTCKLDYEGNAHLSLRRLTDIVEPGLRNKVYCMHLDRQFDISEAVSLGFNIAEIK